MLTKFESKSNRAKGLSFHPSRPWILSSLHNGVIQLWDYRMNTLLDKFEEHDGPVRGIDFHKSQPLFVSGGDDYKIKVWNYKLRRCLFTLLGHLDYIRTVQFHHEYPWIVSASDDQTIRIWNWQSRTCISVLTGHNHYVMCAGFHPRDDLVVSASLDQTVRVWDTSGLRRKTVRGNPHLDDPSGVNNAVISRVNADLFGSTDAVVKYVLEGHDRGVNWASFHHTLPLIISGADDRQVKLWRMNETKAWEVDTMKGHTNNVSCVIFHPRAELIISNSEDRSIRVWDITKRMGLHTFRREHDRFWILAAHPEQNLLAAGHDSGMIVFKLERERPAFDTCNGQLYMVKDRYLRWIDSAHGRDVPLNNVRRVGSGLGTPPRSLEYNKMNPAEKNILVFSSAEGGSYELFTFPQDASARGRATEESKRGSGLAAVFVARTKFAVLEKNRQISIKNLDNINTSKINPVPGTDGLFTAGVAGRLLIRAEDKISLFELQSRRVLAEVVAPRVKYVVWNSDATYVALLCKHAIVICDRQLRQLCTITETVRVKGGAWNANGVFVYATLNHIKYTLVNGDNGIIRTLEQPVYISRIQGDQLHCLDRECKTRVLNIDTSECKFKIALMKKQYGDVMAMIRSSKFCGRAIIGYLQEKGFPEVALHFVEDKKTRFNLALECGNIEVATEAASEVDDAECWKKLGEEALRQGNQKLVEIAYQKTYDLERLSFLYLITGNRSKLQRMMQIAENKGSVMSQFHNSLYLGNVNERVKLLEQAGQMSLAFVTAKTHGLEEDAARIHEFLVEHELPIPDVANKQSLLIPPIPIMPMNSESWPLLEISRTKAFPDVNAAPTQDPYQESQEKGNSGEIDMDNFDFDDEKDEEVLDDFEDGWADEDDELDLGDDIEVEAPKAAEDDTQNEIGGVFVAPSAGPERSTKWCDNSTLAADHAAAGSFQQAMRLLNRQIGVVNFKPLKPAFMELYMSTRCQVPGLPSVQTMQSLLERDDNNPLPEICIKLSALKKEMQAVAYRKFTSGDFTEALNVFRNILCQIPLLAVERHDVRNVKEMLSICREYIVGIMLQLAKADVKDETGVRQTELSAYFTHCHLEPRHLMLPLRAAMTAAYKLQNFITTASFARRLLELPSLASETNATLRKKAAKVLKLSEEHARNKHQLNYDENKSFSICCYDFVPLYDDTAGVVKCPFCGASAGKQYKGKLCNVCQIAQLGVETIGLVCSVESR